MSNKSITLKKPKQEKSGHTDFYLMIPLPLKLQLRTRINLWKRLQEVKDMQTLFHRTVSSTVMSNRVAVPQQTG